MNRSVLSLLAAAALFPSSRGFSFSGGTPPDTLAPRYALEEIVVTVTRADAMVAAVPSSVTVIPRTVIAAMPGSLVSSALAGMSALSLRSYGSGASVQTVSIRGMSPEHTLVLVDGQRYNSFENGLADLGIVSSSDVERIEVVRGGSSALYGADAVGGVVNIITRPPVEKLSASFTNTIGSNHFGADELSLGGGNDLIEARAIIRKEQGRGDYLFNFDDGRMTTELRRKGEDFSVLSGDLRADGTLLPSLKGTVSFSYTDADRGSPGAVTDPSSAGSARLADRQSFLRGGFTWDAADKLTVRINAAAQYSVEHYLDPRTLIDGAPVNSDYTNRSVIVTPEARLALSPVFAGTVGAELARASLTSTETVNALRLQKSAFLTTEHTILLPWEAPYEVVVYPSLRYDSFSDAGGDVSPKVGLNIGLLKKPGLRLRASYGKSFRVPVLNDLYWKEGGNPHLRPERALAFDAGIRAELPWAIQADVGYFTINSQDRIVWVPGAGSFWSPKNIADVRSQGMEAGASWSGFDGALTLSANSTWTDVKKTSADYPGDPTQGKRLIYEPVQTFNAVAKFAASGAGFFLQHSWISYRYTTETNDRFLPAYSVFSAAFRYELPAGPVVASLKLEVTNLFDASYQVVALYPMPMREFRGTLGVAL